MSSSHCGQCHLHLWGASGTCHQHHLKNANFQKACIVIDNSLIIALTLTNYATKGDSRDKMTRGRSNTTGRQDDVLIVIVVAQLLLTLSVWSAYASHSLFDSLSPASSRLAETECRTGSCTMTGMRPFIIVHHWGCRPPLMHSIQRWGPEITCEASCRTQQQRFPTSLLLPMTTTMGRRFRSAAAEENQQALTFQRSRQQCACGSQTTAARCRSTPGGRIRCHASTSTSSLLSSSRSTEDRHPAVHSLGAIAGHLVPCEERAVGINEHALQYWCDRNIIALTTINR